VVALSLVREDKLGLSKSFICAIYERYVTTWSYDRARGNIIWRIIRSFDLLTKTLATIIADHRVRH
jgi:hypothetical protein